MTRATKPILFLAGASLLTATACTSPESVGSDGRYKNTRDGAVLGGILGAAVGALTNDDTREGVVKGAVIGAGVGALAGSALDKQEADLRRDLGNDDVSITNTGDRLIVSLPQDILFETGSSYVRPGLQSDLRAVAGNLNSYPNTTVQVLGHTDNVGEAGYNQDLSERRAQAVANVLTGAGVSGSRIQVSGRGEDQPIASNLTDAGRAQNRRVEIIILPNA